MALLTRLDLRKKKTKGKECTDVGHAHGAHRVLCWQTFTRIVILTRKDCMVIKDMVSEAKCLNP